MQFQKPVVLVILSEAKDLFILLAAPPRKQVASVLRFTILWKGIAR